ncbi:MAG: glycosyltransferase family 1 protein [Bacteroidales bacterium]|nr:glycosyltransferase family 1 protein [Bacteroidales bacterium]
MKIGFDAKRAFFNRSGLGSYSRNTILQLSKYFPENKYFLFTPKYKKKNFHLHSENVHVSTPRNLTGKFFNSYWRTFQLANQIEKKGLDIYHGLSNELPAGIKSKNVKKVVTIHDLIFIRYPEFYKIIDRNIYEKKFRYSCEVADKIIAVSNQTKSDIVNFFKTDESKISVVYQGCDNMFLNEVGEEEKNRIIRKHHLPMHFILYIGTVEERKNLLSVVKAINEGKMDTYLVVIGKPTRYIRQVKQYIYDHRMERKILFLQDVRIEDLPAIYQLAYLFIYPSIFEGFGIPILEALFSKTPVITSKGSCFNEAGGPKSIYIDPSNIEEIIYSMKKVLEDSQLRETMINEGLNYAMNFKDEIVAANLMREYSALK